MSTDRSITVIPEPYPRAAVQLTYGTWADLRDVWCTRSQDKGWTSEVLVARTGPSLSGAMVVSAPIGPRVSDPLTTAALSAIDRQLRGGTGPLLLGGGWGYTAGTVVRRHASRWHDEDVLHALYATAVNRAAVAGREPVALWVPHGHLAAAQEAGMGARCRADVDCYLDLSGFGSHSGYLSGLPKGARQQLNRDARDVAAAGITLTQRPPDAAAAAVHASLVAEVGGLNGVPEPVRLTEIRLARWLARTPEPVLFEAYAEGRVIGVCFGSVDDRTLTLTDVGLANAPERHAAYRGLVFDSAPKFALERGLTRIRLGATHEQMKAMRGATQEPLWHLLPGSQHGRV